MSYDPLMSKALELQEERTKFQHELANANATIEMAMARIEALEEAMKNKSETVLLQHSRIKELEAENARLREALTSMLYIFDRGLEPGTIGRMRCDEAREALNANP